MHGPKNKIGCGRFRNTAVIELPLPYQSAEEAMNNSWINRT